MLEPRVVEGEIADVAQAMNIASAASRQFVILEKMDGKMCAIERTNITYMDEVDDAFIGR